MLSTRAIPQFSILSCLLLLGALGCATTRAGSDFDVEVDFAGFRSFAIAESAARVSAVTDPGVSELLLRRIAKAIREGLVAKGLREGEREGADLLVHFELAAGEKVEVYDWPTGVGLGYGYGSRRVGGYGGGFIRDQQIVSRPVGALVIDLVDRETGMLVWHGWSKDRIVRTSDRDDRARRAVETILKRYPPNAP